MATPPSALHKSESRRRRPTETGIVWDEQNLVENEAIKASGGLGSYVYKLLGGLPLPPLPACLRLGCGVHCPPALPSFPEALQA